MSEFVGEAIEAGSATFDTEAMSRGEPGLPNGFRWRGEDYDVVALMDRWKGTSREGARAGGEVYLRRHYYKLGMSDGSVWTVYFVRQAPRSGRPTRRWFLYTVE